jgi:hypothetical protein
MAFFMSPAPCVFLRVRNFSRYCLYIVSGVPQRPIAVAFTGNRSVVEVFHRIGLLFFDFQQLRHPEEIK